MKKRNVILSLLLTAVLLCGICVPAFASDGYVPYDRDDHYTQIYIEGLVSKWVTPKDDPTVSLFAPVDTDRLKAAFGNVKTYLMDAVKKGDPRLAYHAVYDPVYDCFGEAALLPDGITMKDTVTVAPTRLYEMDGNKFLFQFDPRLDPVDIAKELDDYIQWVKRDGRVTRSRYHNTVTDTIELVASSYGAEVLLAYLNEYGYDKIDSALLCVPTTGGVRLVSELFTGELTFSASALRQTLQQYNLLSDYDPLIEVLEKSGALQQVIDHVAQPALKSAVEDALHDLIHDIVGTMPAFWSFIDDEHFDAALDYVFPTDEDKAEHQLLIDRVRYYHENIFNHTADIINTAVSKGIHFNIVCKYNSAPLPICTNDSALTDGFIPCEEASFGATCAKIGQKLPATYTQQKLTDYNFVSPDRMIDASTGLLPFNTWYIKDLWHGTKCDEYFDLLNRIIYDNLTVFSDETRPQFLQWDGAESLLPLQADTPAQEIQQTIDRSWAGTLLRFLRFLVNMVKKWFHIG